MRCPFVATPHAAAAAAAAAADHTPAGWPAFPFCSPATLCSPPHTKVSSSRAQISVINEKQALNTCKHQTSNIKLTELIND
ncbi:hypothetical protein B5S30_g1420 [[Candida] boidinii]|nr:hypothetical protein B5S30_g1420 [[Candida] boidinii]